MKGFLSWFKSSTKMKRWLFVILVGIVLVTYGISTVLVTKEMEVLDIVKIIVIFTIGFTITIVGVIFALKRILEVLIEASDLRLEKGKKNVNLKSLIFDKKIYNKGPNIVVIGGGTGLNTVLRGLKNYTNNITAIVTISDYGRLPSNSRRQLNMLPLEDVKDSLIALSYNEEIMKGMLDLKFENPVLRDLNFGDIYLLGMQQYYGDFVESIEKTSTVLNTVGRVLPVTLDEIKICAELDNGMVVEEKEKIPEIVYDKITKINRIYVAPSNCIPAPGVLETIQQADAIVIGPGSLYTNVIPNLLIKNVSKTIKESKAIKIYVSNIMTEPGQTDNYSVSDHVKAILDHTGKGIIDYCIYDTGEIVPEYVRKYNLKGQDMVDQDIQEVKNEGIKVVKRNLSKIVDNNIRHNSKAVAEAIIDIICDDLKYKDKQYDPQYVMLNSRLKQQKKASKNLKPIFKTDKTKNNDDSKKTSKFNEKYKDRIVSIKTSDFTTTENRRKAEREYKNKRR